jgi:elongation factor Ts
MITTEQIKELRNRTGISIGQCKNALEEAGGDIEKAIIILSKKGGDIAAKKAGRELKSGTIASYIHNGGKVGAMVEIACETDFVAKNEEFKKLAYDIAMQVAATNPTFLKREDITEEDQKKAGEVFAEEVKDKPEEMKEKILKGKLDSYFKDKVLLEQSFIKDSEKTIKDLIEGAIHKFGEKTEIIKFVYFVV